MMDGDVDQEFMIGQINKASLILKTNDPTYKYKHRDNRTKEEILAQKHLEHLKQLERIKTDEEHLEYQRNLLKSRGINIASEDGEGELSGKQRSKSSGVFQRLFVTSMKEDQSLNMRQFYSRSQILNKLEKLEKNKGSQPASVENIRSELRLEKFNKTLDFKKEIGYNPTGTYMRPTWIYERRLEQSREMRHQLERSSSEDYLNKRGGSVRNNRNKNISPPESRFASTSHSAKRAKRVKDSSGNNTAKVQTLMRYSGKALAESEVLSKIDGMKWGNQYLKGTYFVNPQAIFDDVVYSKYDAPKALGVLPAQPMGIFKNFPFFSNSDDFESLIKPNDCARKPNSLLVGLENKPL